ncbi:MAG TPA: phosphoadenosine phosphosulfate reductase [Cytophagales bacterium]|nr:phosphoadenosine phosphosulfate reductase [Cytophagales bacterium]HAP58680.1 phosphoadenosine phosphosulfate reductase [Cytophagales bacterium]
MTNNQDVRHVIGISGGKDSAALAIYLHDKHPELPLEYYFCDTGKELDETYELIERLEAYLGKSVTKLETVESDKDTPFDHFLEQYGGYLPSSISRWCTKKMKLEPFEKWVGTGPVISYVGIRDDENRDGYISKKTNIQTIFPFRHNLWSEDVIRPMLAQASIPFLHEAYAQQLSGDTLQRIQAILDRPIGKFYAQAKKLSDLLNVSALAFNHVTQTWMQAQERPYPIGQLNTYSLLDNEDRLVKADIFRLLEESGVGVPEYYQERTYEVNGKVGRYARSRSGCFFCFYQQKIEWVWLYEQHPKLFKKAMQYEKDGYSWSDEETLEELIQPARIQKIKEDALVAYEKAQSKKSENSPYLLDILTEEDGCAACFI